MVSIRGVPIIIRIVRLRALGIILVLVAVIGMACANEPQVADRDIHVPNTISSEAQQLLAQLDLNKGYTRTVPSTDDPAVWRLFYDGIEATLKEGGDKAITANNVTVIKANLGGTPVLDIRPENWTDNGKVLVYTHGGAYTLFSAHSTLGNSAAMSRTSGLRVISVDYTTPPFARWEEIQEQVISVFEALLDEGYTMDDIAIFGDSAGGGLTTSTVLNLRDRGMGMPKVVFLMAPWVDLTNEGDTAHTLADEDPSLDYTGLLEPSAQLYADGLDLSDPRVSPINADFSQGFPPTLIQAGTKEIFLSTAVRLYQKLLAEDQDATLDVYEGMPHVFQQFPIPEAQVAFDRASVFINMHLK